MLTTLTPGRNERQWTFFGLLFIPIFGLMFILGVYMGRSTDQVFPIILTSAIIAVIGTIVILGLNYRIGLYMIMFFVLWDRVSAIGSEGNLTATKIVIGLTIIFTLTAVLNREIPDWWRKFGDPIAILGFLFLLFSVLPLPFMPHPEISTQFLQRRVNVVALMLIILITVTNRDIFHRAIFWLVIGGITVAIASTSEIITGVGLLERMGRSNPDKVGSGLNSLGAFAGRTRIVGPSGDPTFYGLAQSLPGVLTLGLILYYRAWWKKLLLSLGLAVIALNIAGTGSRAGALSFITGVVVVLMTCPLRHRMLKMTLIFVVGILGLAGLYLSGADIAAQRIAAPATALQTVDMRLALWRMAMQVFYANPVLGSGTNGFGFWYWVYHDPMAPPILQRPLNAFLQLLAENGIQGMLVYVLMYVVAAISALSAGLGTDDRRLKFQAMTLAAILIGFFIFSGTSNVLENELYYIVFGLCGASYHVYVDERRRVPRLGPDRLAPAPELAEVHRLAARQRLMYPARG